MKAIYINLDGTTFEGPVFNPYMDVVTLEGGKSYVSHIVRRELGVDAEGKFVFPEESK